VPCGRTRVEDDCLRISTRRVRALGRRGETAPSRRTPGVYQKPPCPRKPTPPANRRPGSRCPTPSGDPYQRPTPFVQLRAPVRGTDPSAARHEQAAAGSSRQSISKRRRSCSSRTAALVHSPMATDQRHAARRAQHTAYCSPADALAPAQGQRPDRRRSGIQPSQLRHFNRSTIISHRPSALRHFSRRSCAIGGLTLHRHGPRPPQ